MSESDKASSSMIPFNPPPRNAPALIVPAGNRSGSLEPQTLQEAMILAEQAASSKLYAAVTGAPVALMLVLQGRQLGFSAAQSLLAFDVIKGRIAMRAHAMRALCVAHRDLCEYFRLRSSTAQEAVYIAKRRDDTEPLEMRFTIEQARRAGLLDKDNWKAWPDDMLRARCVSKLARELFPDVLFGLYSTEEIIDGEGVMSALAVQDVAARVVGGTGTGAGELPPIGGTHLIDSQREWIQSCTDLDKLTKAKIKFLADAAKHGSEPAEEDVFLFERRADAIKAEQAALEAQAKRAEAAESEASSIKAAPPQDTLPALSDKAIERMRLTLWSLKTQQEIDDWSAGLTVTPGLAEALAPDIEQHRQKVGG